MSTAALSSAPSEPAALHKHVVRAALHELLQMGLRVAAASARLAEVELEAAEFLSKTVALSANVAKPQETLAEAIQVGQMADISEAARDLSACRMALITTTFERASRAVRRTAALADRIEQNRPWRMDRDPQAPCDAGPGEATARRADRSGEDLYERLDAPEIDDETRGRSPTQVLADIQRDLRAATTVKDARPVDKAAEPVPAGRPKAPRVAKPANDSPDPAEWTRPAWLPEPDT